MQSKMLVPIALVTILVQTTFCQDLDVVIIGGGSAGIAAATRLDKSGVKFVLLEAESRLGGRVYTVPFGQSKVDLGAQWVHGEQGNIVYELMNDTGLLHHTEKPYKIYFSNRTDLDEEFSNELLQIYFDIDDSLYKNNTDNENLGDAFTRLYLQKINENYSSDKEKLHLATQVLTLFEKYVCSVESAPNWHLPSAKTDFDSPEGDAYMHWNGNGYFSVLDFLMRNFNATGKIFTNKVVTRIEYDANKVTVKGEDFSYEAKYALFTPSLGVLKHTHRQLFHPPLSDRKAEAIDKLGFGAVGKVWMHFKEPWWNSTNSVDFDLVWNNDDRLTLHQEFPRGPQKNGNSWLTDLYNVLKAEENPNVLTAWFAGEFVPDIEKMADDVLIDGIVFTLDKFLGHSYTVQRPDKILWEKWHTNVHFHGTYSYQTLASRAMKPNALTTLAEPVDNLFFAGEATNVKHFSTVNGAIETGFREADRLIKKLDVV